MKKKETSLIEALAAAVPQTQAKAPLQNGWTAGKDIPRVLLSQMGEVDRDYSFLDNLSLFLRVFARLPRLISQDAQVGRITRPEASLLLSKVCLWAEKINLLIDRSYGKIIAPINMSELNNQVKESRRKIYQNSIQKQT